MKHERKGEEGFALVMVMLLAALLMALLGAYFTLSYMERVTTTSTMSSVRGFYAAEAGLNLRAEGIRSRFLGFNRPAGSSPTINGTECNGSNEGVGDFECTAFGLDLRSVATYVVESPDNPISITVPRGEQYQNLSAKVYDYDVRSVARGPEQDVEAILEMRFQSRLVPLFQFAAFYNKDLEILPGPPMVLNGPVHTNKDLYLDAGNSLDILGQVTSAEGLYLGRKNSDSCSTGNVAVIDPATLTDLPGGCSGTRSQVVQSQVAGWNGMVTLGVDALTVPPPEALDPNPGEVYWDKADMRVVLDIDISSTTIEVRNRDGSTNSPHTALLASCPAASHHADFYNHREGTAIQMLDIDVAELLECIYANNALISGRALDDDTEDGLVVYLGVDGPNSNVVNNYGVRVLNGDELAAATIGAPAIEGLTFVTNQAAYVQGDYNVTNKKPAAFLADSLNILSNDWDDSNSAGDLTGRIAGDTTINAAFLAGTDSTGGADGVAAQDSGNYNGGLENFPHFHENWSGRDLVYRGSFVSLNTPRHVDGSWGSQSYSPPNRDWDFDVDLRDPANLPPISPRFVYLRQELFVREFEL